MSMILKEREKIKFNILNAIYNNLNPSINKKI